jgi:TonB family protein
MNAPDLPDNFPAVTELKPGLHISERVETMSKAQLLDIVAQPHVEEDDWVAACHELERRGQLAVNKPGSIFRRKDLVKRARIVVVSLFLVTASIGLIRYFLPQPQAALVTPPVVARADVDFGPYMANLQRNIKHAWFPPTGSETSRIKVAFAVDGSGHMDKLRMLIPTSSNAANEAALAAIRNTVFEPLPPGAPPNVTIEFSFDYNVRSKNSSAPEDDFSHSPQP